MGWLTYKLGDICDFQGGSQPPKSVFIQEEKDGYIRLLQIRDFKSDDKAIYIPEAKKNRICKNDDVMLARYGASVGQVHRGKSGAYNVALIKTIPNTDIIDKDFLYLYLHSESFQKRLMSVAERSAQAGFSKADISPFEVSVPPIPEQKRIVAILDQVFADIEQARAKTEQNLKNARELFESYLQQVFSQRGEGREDSTLNVVAENLDSKRVPITKKDRIEGDYPYYGASGIVDYVDGYIFDEELLLVSEDGANLLARTYPIAFSASGRYWVNNHAHVLKFKDRNTQKFIEYYLNSISLAPYVSGMAQPKLNQRALNSIPVPKVTKLIAGEVVSKLEVLENEINQVYKIYKYKLDSLDELKKSILQKAFSGELTKTLEVDTNKGAVA